jgi:hypothetical protein
MMATRTRRVSRGCADAALEYQGDRNEDAESDTWNHGR